MNGGRVTWLSSGDAADSFPPLEQALTEPNGLLAAGGDLHKDRLLYAYQHGIFPWYDDGQPLLWWSPDPRCVFLPGDFRVSKRTSRYLRTSQAEVRVNTAFAEVIAACAASRRSQQGTWITAEMSRAYQELHDHGWAHSVEVWEQQSLVGGLYGVGIGRAFFGESMFSRRSNSSKMALLYLVERMQTNALDMIDCQLHSRHLQTLGAREISRQQFVQHLDSACYPLQPFENWPTVPIKVAQLLQIHD